MIDFLKLPSPCYVLDEELLDRNLATVDRVRRESGAEIIVALKACAMWSIFPELAKHSDGATASSAAEARLVFEEFVLLWRWWPNCGVPRRSSGVPPPPTPRSTRTPISTKSSIAAIISRSIRCRSSAASARKPLSTAFPAACGSTRSIRPSRRTSTTPASPARGWASRPNSWRRTADFRRVSRGCISTSSANRARSICKRRWRPSRRISERISTGSNGSTWAAAT